MDVLLVTTELSPYARVSRTGDAVAALAKALCQLEHRVTVAVPRHPGFEASGLLVARRLTPLDLEGGGQVTVLDGQLPTGAKLVLFDFPRAEGEGAEEAAALHLGRAAAALVKQRAERNEPFDVVHVHDMDGAPAAAFLRASGAAVPAVLTVHDGGRRGLVPPERLAGTGLDRGADIAREGGNVSLLALGARAADAVIAVAPALSSALRDVAVHGALARVLVEKESEPVGILSGLDYAVCNPATDAALKSRFDAEDTANKGSSKTELLRNRGLELEPPRPLVVAFLEEGPDSGEALLVESLPALMKNDPAVVVLVRGEGPVSPALEAVVAEYPGRVAAFALVDEPMLRRACAAADLVLLPAGRESTGTLSRLAQRYGAVPVGRAEGAHVDTIVDADAALETGTGFLFDEATPDALAGAVARGLAAYGSPRFGALRRRVMRLDLSWDRPARRTVQVYKQAVAARARAAAR